MNKKFLLLLSVILLALVSCDNPFEATKQTDGSLSLHIDAVDTTRTILPSISMDIVTYDIKGESTNGKSFISEGIGTKTFNTICEKGEWSITVDAKNSSGNIIYSGNATCSITPGETTIVNITIRPLNGVGTLDLTLDWVTNILHTPQIVSSLTPFTGAIKNLDFTILDNKGTHSSTVETGYHTLIVKLLDNGVLTRGAVEVVRIVKDQTTDYTFTFNDINEQSGIIDINIVQDLSLPLDVILTGLVSEVAVNKQINMTASVPDYSDNITYVWYINGEVQATGDNLNPNYVFGGFEKGFYRLDVTAFTTDGKRAGSATWDLQVTDAVPLADIVDIKGGLYHNLALKADGTVWAWGQNKWGQLGNNTIVDSTIPIVVPGLSDVTAIDCGAYHNIALKSDKTVWVWGWNSKGQLGNNTTTDSLKPIKIEGLDNVITIATGQSVTMVLKEDGTVWAWGDNSYGQLADGTNGNKHIPAKMPNLSNIEKISFGQYHAYAKQDNGYVWTWGCDFIGALGLGTVNEHKSTPTRNIYLNNATLIEPGYYTSTALYTDGTVWEWGTTADGQKTKPTNVIGINNVDKLSVGYAHKIAIKEDGTFWIWGDNSGYQIGDGTSTYRKTPLNMSNFNSPKAVFAVSFGTFIIKADNTLWAWGRNSNGQIGDGTTEDRLTPIQINMF